MFHKSARGKTVNFDEMVLKNAKTIAVGNANLNARGDLIGRSGQIVETVEERTSSNIVTSSSKASIQSEIAALKAARNGWTNESIPDAVVAEDVPVVQEEASQDAPVSETPKKARKITESE